MKKLLNKIINQILRMFYPIIWLKYRNIHVLTIGETIRALNNNKYSLSRFGDGEISWLLMKNSNSFEENSLKLRQSLIKVLLSRNSNLKIGLPGVLCNSSSLNIHAKRFYRLFMVKNGLKFFKYLNRNKIYYNTDVSRCYIGYKNRKKSSIYFKNIKKIWKNRNILIIEGNRSRLGVGNRLFNNVNKIKRIECPYMDAFESYNEILSCSLEFLNNSNNYLVLISLGPTATILAYDLCNRGYQSIDIGHLDLEYEWFLLKAKQKIDIPTRDVNEVKDGSKVVPVNDNKYKNEIIKRIK